MVGEEELAVREVREEEEKEDVSSGSESDEEEEATGEGGAKRWREGLDEDEVEALKQDLGDDARQGKRVRRSGAEQLEHSSDAASESKGQPLSVQSEEAWKAFRDQPLSYATTEDKVEDSSKKEETVLVKRSYRFAGEQVHEEKRLPASHPEAIAYLASLKHPPPSNETAPTSASPDRTLHTAASAAKAAPGPRKKKSSLAAMSAAATGKPTKINTLEKSKMDWNKYKEQNVDERERDEMEAQTKGGSSGLGSMKGYMERQNFLERVQGRLEGQQKKP